MTWERRTVLVVVVLGWGRVAWGRGDLFGGCHNSVGDFMGGLLSQNGEGNGQSGEEVGDGVVVFYLDGDHPLHILRLLYEVDHLLHQSSTPSTSVNDLFEAVVGWVA
jgi:hypothetical protein